MKRASSFTLRPALAIFFLFAGLVTLSQEAHCLGETLALDMAHTASHEANGEHHHDGAAHETHTCHHEQGKHAISGWTFLNAPASGATQPVFVAQTLTWHQTLSLVSPARFAPAPAATPPPLRRSATGAAGIFAETSRLLI
tara:strand:- start:3418 stop:3840 length:423 start_codon:yes stop_codon:yes gene_type:complete